MERLLSTSNYPDLERDFTRWDAFVEALRESSLFKFIQGGMQGAAWDAMTPEDHLGVMSSFVRSHEKAFGYYAAEISIGNPGSGGFWTFVMKNEDGTFGGYDAGINIPLLGKDDALQFLFYALARNYLLTRYTKSDAAYADLTSDYKDYNTMEPLIDDELNRLKEFPMPREFKTWIDRPSARYALQAVSYLSSQLLGTPDISPKIMDLLMKDYMENHRDILAMVQNHDDGFKRFSKLNRSLWRFRAQDYIDIIMDNPELHDPLEALRVMDVARKNDIALIPPPNLKEVLQRDPNLKALHVGTRMEAISYVRNHSSATFRQLSPEAILHVIDMLGPQKDLSLRQRKLCDEAAQELLRAWPLSEPFLEYYRHEVKTLAQSLCTHEKLNELGAVWMETKSPVARWTFLEVLKTEMAQHFGVNDIPLIPYSKAATKEKNKNFDTKDSRGFATQFADLDNLKEEDNLILPPSFKHKPLIGINIHKDFSLLTASNPMEAARVIIHEIGHHVVDHVKMQYLDNALGKQDPRYAQAEEYRDIATKADIDRRLREEFSRALYPLIQTEKFEYWLMDEFENNLPFAHLTVK